MPRKKEQPDLNEGIKNFGTQLALEFAKGLYNTKGFYEGGVFTPFTQNQNLIGLNNNLLKTDYDKITNALNNAITMAPELQGYSEYMKTWDTIYRKTLDLYAGMLSFDLSYTCKNINDPSEYKSTEYQADLKRIHKFFDSFDYKREFHKAIVEMLRTEIYPCWFRDSYGTINNDSIDLDSKKLNKYALQMMPSKYCLLTGYSADTIMWDFDMNYFLNPTVDINLFDPSFKRKFKDVFSSEYWEYNPSSQYGDRNGTYTTYAQMSPDDGMWTFKFDESNFNLTPPFANLMKAVFNNTKIQELQLDKDFNSAVALLMGELRIFESGQSGTQPDQFSITPEVVGMFMNLIKNSLQNTFKEVALPLENSKMYQFEDKNENMVTNALDNSAGQGAFGSSIVYSTGKKGQSEFINGLLSDYILMKRLYPQFEAFMNFFINKKTRKYKFNFTFDGSNYPFEREYRTKRINELFSVGLVPNESYIASTYGIKPQDFSRMLEESKYGDLQSKLSMLLNKNTMSGESAVGNPVKSDTAISDSGDVSRNYS